MDVVLLSELKCLMNNWVRSPSMDCLHLHSSVEKGKNSFFRAPSQKQGQLMCLLPQKNSWPCCMGGQAYSWSRTQGCKLQGIRSSPTRSGAILTCPCGEDGQGAGISAATLLGVITQCKGHSQWTGASSCSKYLLSTQSEDAPWYF